MGVLRTPQETMPNKTDIKDLIDSAIQSALKELGMLEQAPLGPYADFATDSRFGEFTSNLAMRLSKPLKKPPFKIGADIVAALQNHIQNSSLKDKIREIKLEGAGFINFYLYNRYFYGELKEIIEQGGDYFRAQLLSEKKALVEFVSANPTGPLSVAHARQAVVGDALTNILDFRGYKTSKEYYLNDEGNQINILGNSVLLRFKELSGETIDFPEDHYQGEYIYDIARKIRDSGKDIKDFSLYAVEYILDIIKKELQDFGVEFDTWYSQKSLRESGKIEQAFKYLKEKGFLYEQDGALWFKSTQFGDDKDRVVIKSDGSYTYLAPDIAYHREKYARGYQWLINLWGPDHHGYIARLKASVNALGQDPESLSVIIVQLASIFREGKPVQMSTRRGQYITLREILDEVGRDASRFFFLMRKTSSHLDFDLEVAKKQTAENPVYYVQYAYARICSILRNSEASNPSCGALAYELLKEKEEIILIKQVWKLSYVLNTCVETHDPYMVTVYLQELAECFHKFYDAHRVLNQEADLSAARLSLLQGVKIALSTALKLIGVSQPEKM